MLFSFHCCLYVSSKLIAEWFQVVILWNLHDFSCMKTVTTYEVLEGVCAIHSGPLLSSCLSSCKQKSGKKSGLPAICFITVGERGVVRIWNSEG